MKDEFVMVPRAALVRLQENMDPHRGAVAWGIVCDLLEKQHQGEPVALPDRHVHEHHGCFLSERQHGWNACLDEIAKLGPLYSHPMQGEPVGTLLIGEYFDNREIGEVDVQLDSKACDQLAEKYPGQSMQLYTHADPGEVEQHIARRMEMAEQKTELHRQIDTLRARLDERDALLREIQRCGLDAICIDGPSIRDRLGAALSASAEPSAPAPMPAYMEAACDKFDWTPEEALRFYAEGKHFDTDNGRTRILCTGAIASHALKGMSQEYADMKGAEPSAPVIHPISMKTMMQAYEQVDHKAMLHGTSNWCAAMATALRGTLHSEPSAAVERHGRAEVKPDAWRASINGNWEYFRSYEQALKELREWQSDYLPEELEEAKADGLCEPEPVYSRAARGRKP